MSAQDDTRKLTVLAVDDEPSGLKILQDCLHGNVYVGSVSSATDATEALRVLGQTEPEQARRKEQGLPPVDIVFADINMPGLSGIELARVFNALEPAPLLIFVTGHDEYALEAFELGAIDYLRKPCKQERLDTAVERALPRLRQGPQRQAESSEGTGGQQDEEVIAVELAGTTRFISRAAVRWVEAQGDYARLFTTEGSHLVRVPLAQLEERWSGAGFVRIHRSYLVALSVITELRMGQGGYQVVLGEEEKFLPVSRRHTRELKDKLTGSARLG